MGSGVHPASYPMGNRGSIDWGKVAMASSPSSAKVKNVWSYISTQKTLT